jgi:hypothetical protein
MSKAFLAKVVAEHCDVAALMQFARVPFVRQTQSRLTVSDLRFDRGQGGGMSTIPLGDASEAPCRPEVPWIPPRLDLLQ